ncbi:MAG: hypothetical protein NC039_03105 [Muribaculaceae bacterium]|nr:hypothetical protein [Muribaculaceae bacterium]
MRPNAPSKQVVTSAINECGLLSIEFRYPEGVAEVAIAGGEEYVVETFDTAVPFVTTVSDPTCTYQITITTAAPHTYEGSL